MKTILKISTVVGLLFTVAMGMAKEPKVNLISQGKVKNLEFLIDAPAKESFVKLTDNNGNIIFSEKVSSGTYAKKFNLSALDKGRYYFSSENAIKAYVFTLEIDDSELILLHKKEIAKPVFRHKGDRLFLNLLNLDRNRVYIKVVDSYNRVVFKDTIEGERIVEKAFNFEQAYEDRYMIVVRNENEVYYEFVVVK